MENKKKKSTGLLLSILGVISLVLITAGVTYAFFSYAKQGQTENTISTGKITFVYNEDSQDGLSIQNALPKSDSVGIAENATQAFEFSVNSTTPSTATIDYIVTARMKDGSTLPQDQVKLYLTSQQAQETAGAGYGVLTGTAAGSISTFADLTDVTNSAYNNILKTGEVANNVVEKVLYKGQIAANSNNYTRNFKLNMWLKGAEGNEANGVADYSAYEFVKKSAVSGTEPLDVETLISGNNILKSVPYYTGVEGGTINASEYERIAYVDQTNGKIYTVSQAAAIGFTAPDTISQGATWAESEQYYPLNGQTFTVTINVYAEGSTTYTTPGA